MEIPNETVDEILHVLLRQVGDTRACPKCNNAFVPHDYASIDAHATYRLLKKIKEKQSSEGNNI